MTAAVTGLPRTLLKYLKYLKKMTIHADVKKSLAISELENKDGCTTK